jgi:hypothetical protein
MTLIFCNLFVPRPELYADGDCSRYQWSWGDRHNFGEIQVSEKMMIDHYPDNVHSALLDLANSTSDIPIYSVI